MKKMVAIDCEVFPNYFLFSSKEITTNKVVSAECYGKDVKLDANDIKLIKAVMKGYTTFGFNSLAYDIPIIKYALEGHTAHDIFEKSNEIIRSRSRIGSGNISAWDHFDIKEPCPGVMVSLKTYGGRMHAKKLQSLPLEPDHLLTVKEVCLIKSYCVNDLDTTIALYRKIEGSIDLRRNMSKEYNQNLLSKSDAQIAEAVIKSKITTGDDFQSIYPNPIPPGKTFTYRAPRYVKFKSSDLNSALAIIKNHQFELDGKGSIKLPSELKNLKIKIGKSVYKLGLGGIHSSEKAQTITPSDDQILEDRDVAAYYPSIILNLGLYPEHLGSHFLEVYEKLVDTRLKAKLTGDKVTDSSLKIVINGSFGKLGSPYSAIYSPGLMLTVTITGQLSLLMLIERLEAVGVSVVSANTDGIVSLIPKSQYNLYESVCKSWESDTNFTLESSQYSGLYSKDVNNYIAVKLDGTYKTKGVFSPPGLQKNPLLPICSEAIIDLIVNHKELHSTIRQCKDISKFVAIRSVRGGAQWKGKALGKVARWVYTLCGEAIRDAKSGNKVAKSDGAFPVMELPNRLPVNLDYDKYIRESESLLESTGYYNFLM